MRKKMKGKLCIPWFILMSFWADRSGVSVHRAGLRRGNGVIKLPCPLFCCRTSLDKRGVSLWLLQVALQIYCRALWDDTLHFHVHYYFWCFAKE